MDFVPIIVALIAAVASIAASVTTLAGVIVSGIITNRKTEQQLEKNQALNVYKIEELTREVREHNNFAKRMPVVEEQIKVINHRLEDLEKIQQKGATN